MIDLKKDVMEVVDKLNKCWIDCVREGTKEDSDGIDLTAVMNKYSELIRELDDKWNEGMVRLSGKGKKGFFGG